jgi:hypothetical protein
VIADRGSNSLTPSAIADCAELDPVTGPEGEMTKGRWVSHGRNVYRTQCRLLCPMCDPKRNRSDELSWAVLLAHRYCRSSAEA